MRKLSLFFAMLCFAYTAQAQDDGSSKVDNNDYNNYNHWSIELQGGVTKPARPMASGYATESPDFWQADLGVRYMINEKFGLKLSAGYNHFEHADGTNPFESQILRGQLEGVVNIGNVLGFRDWTNTFNVLAHAGAGYASMSADNPVDYGDDQMGFIVAGITPQVRLSNHFALSLDASIFGNFSQDRTFDGSNTSNTRGFNGYYLNGSIGLTYYIGAKAKKHADWYGANDNPIYDQVAQLSDDVSKIKSDMQDTDRDGVPDYLDKDNSTPAGLAVDNHGRTIDNNNNNIPDELEEALDARYASASSSSNGTIEELINNGYVNVYFKFDSAQPEIYSLQAINYLVIYMTENPSANAEIVGYADEIGNPDYNKQLSVKRAEKVKSILVANGIDADRLEVKGNGEDTSVDKGSKDARQMVRRVTFKLK